MDCNNYDRNTYGRLEYNIALENITVASLSGIKHSVN